MSEIVLAMECAFCDEIFEYDEDQKVRVICDACLAVWDA